MGIIVNNQLRSLVIFAQFEWIHASNHVALLRLHLYISFAGVWLVGGNSIPFVRIDSFVFLI